MKCTNESIVSLKISVVEVSFFFINLHEPREFIIQKFVNSNWEKKQVTPQSLPYNGLLDYT